MDLMKQRYKELLHQQNHTEFDALNDEYVKEDDPDKRAMPISLALAYLIYLAYPRASFIPPIDIPIYQTPFDNNMDNNKKNILFM